MAPMMPSAPPSAEATLTITPLFIDAPLMPPSRQSDDEAIIST